MPTSRDESTGNKTAWHVESRKSLQKTERGGRNPHRVVRFHRRIGFTSHERELLSIFQVSSEPGETDTAEGVGGVKARGALSRLEIGEGKFVLEPGPKNETRKPGMRCIPGLARSTKVSLS